MQMTGLHTYDMSAPLRQRAHMYERGRANVRHDKSTQRGPLCMCLKRAKAYSFMISTAAPSHQEAGTTLKTDTQDRSRPVQHAGVR